MDTVAVRGRQVGPALVVAVASIIAGGLVAAATAQIPSERTSWATAYLVLVCGVGTLGLALGRAFLSPGRPSDIALAGEFGTWILGNALVLVGTLAELTWLLDLGGLLLVVALALVVVRIRRGPGPRWVRAGFTSLVVLLLVSVPVGLALARLRD
ncbi:MAG: hypothetical protein L0H25_07745 [Micrococcales bacterium]|nr:hypothetical protein [Micrococcales bacterium]